MINGNIVNGNTINGDSGIDFLALVYDNVSISESLSFSTAYGLPINEQVYISENLSFFFNKGIDVFEGVSISETVNIELGDLILHVDDEPVHIIEETVFNLQKGFLMTDFIKYYLDLLIIQYKNKPKAVQHVTTLVTSALIDLMPSILENCFNLETAEGVQLDTLGKYIGVSRRVQTFGSDVTLNDSEYRTLLKIKRATNSLGSSFYDIQKFINENLNGIILAFDHADMSMSFYLSSIIVSNTLAQAIVKQNILPKPMGVSYAAIVYLPDLTNIFGFRTYTFDSGSSVGFNTYSSYHPEYRLLKYENTI